MLKRMLLSIKLAEFLFNFEVSLIMSLPNLRFPSSLLSTLLLKTHDENGGSLNNIPAVERLRIGSSRPTDGVIEDCL